MTAVKAIATVTVTAIGFALCGTAIGLLLGKIAPAFLRYAVRIPTETPIDVVELGIGLGLTNGLTWGLVTGMLLVAVITWKESRRRNDVLGGGI